MIRPTTREEIEDLLDRLEQLPFLGQPLRADPTLRERLRHRAHLSVEKLASPRSQIERTLRQDLRERIGWQ